MNHMAVVRSMSTREADHNRGRYYMHTGYVPESEHRASRATARSSAHELADKMPQLEIPPFVSVGGGSVGPGFLGMTWAPFVVDSNGDVRNVNTPGQERDHFERMGERLTVLEAMEKDFISENRGDAADDHYKMLKKTVSADDQQANGGVQSELRNRRPCRKSTAKRRSAKAA